MSPAAQQAPAAAKKATAKQRPPKKATPAKRSAPLKVTTADATGPSGSAAPGTTSPEATADPQPLAAGATSTPEVAPPKAAKAAKAAKPRAARTPARKAAIGGASTDPKPRGAKKAAAPPKVTTGPAAARTADPETTNTAYVSEAARTTAGAAAALIGGRPAAEDVPKLRALLARVLDRPGYAPELLALTAVEVLGPRAAEWAGRLRESYPQAGPEGLARLAGQRFLRQATIGGAGAALAGVFAPVVELAVVLWSQANLVLHLAAAYDRDPAHPDRAAELLVLTLVHPDLETARSALAEAQAANEPGSRPVDAVGRLAGPLTAQAGGWLALRLASRLIPGAAPLTAAAGNSAALQRLTARALTTFRPPRSQS
ncbi:hypothetical protein [Micromonospora sp. DT229]|uniref:hypothetical protein n=1 Tax=Micromonospora sp. DT229 TaxID=3393430 RepID=UPI003CECEE14